MLKECVMSVLCLVLLVSCSPERGQNDDVPYQIGEILYEGSFDGTEPTDWVVEAEDDIDLADCFRDGVLIMNVPGGITVWNTTKFRGDVMFEFEATVVQAGGDNDRVSDLNCFWMATDPESPDDFFARSAWRNGIFWRYYSLNLYYVGYGGHDNTKTRMRRYDTGLPPPPPVIQEYTDAEQLISPNKKNRIRIVSSGPRVMYFFNENKLFDFVDERPYKEGYFGFRTTNSHIRIEDFKVYTVGK